MPYCALMRYYQSFPTAIPHNGAGCPRVTHPSATQSSQSFGRSLRLKSFVRLACVRHAASVHPEPGSNSHFKVCTFFKTLLVSSFFSLSVLPNNPHSSLRNYSGLHHCSVVKVRHEGGPMRSMGRVLMTMKCSGLHSSRLS